MEKEMATHSSILAWKIPWREEPGVSKELDTTEHTHTHTHKHAYCTLMPYIMLYSNYIPI